MDQVITIPPVVPHGLSEVLSYFGDPKFTGAADASVDPKWESSNLEVVRDLPCGIPKMYVHRLIEQPLRAALARAEATGWSPKVKVVGCFQPRLIRGSSTRMSTHTLAIAIDLDPDDNKLVECPSNPLALWPVGDARRVDPGPRTIPDVVVACFKAEGWFWGGEFHDRYDPMHFQFCTGM